MEILFLLICLKNGSHYVKSGFHQLKNRLRAVQATMRLSQSNAAAAAAAALTNAEIRRIQPLTLSPLVPHFPSRGSIRLLQMATPNLNEEQEQD